MTGRSIPIFSSFIGLGGLALAALAPATAASAAPQPTLAVEQLARQVDATASVRAIKRVQVAYAQYAQAGMWRAMADLFATGGELTYGATTVRGPHVHRYLLETFGKGREGLPPGGLNTEMVVMPVINLSIDGKRAKGRWNVFSMAGRYGGRADWSGGVFENDYVREGGVWKIARLRYFPIFMGPYETGWFNLEADAKVIPYHFSAAEAGQPIPPQMLRAARTAPNRTANLVAIERQVSAMVDEDKIVNLQSAYGYYLDQKMWDDVVDLFTPDAALELAGIGVYRGPKGVRRALELSGAAGLKAGELNDHVLFDTVVTVAPSGLEARIRGLDFTQLGDTESGKASIGVAVFENRLVKQGGVWRIHEMRVFPQMKADYYLGWHKSALPETAPPPSLAPDAPSPPQTGAIPEFFYPHPVTGKAVAYPAGATATARDRLAPVRAAAVPAARGSLAQRLVEARAKAAAASAYDGVENIASAFGYWIDDFQWDKSSALFTPNGRRGKYQIGFYAGPEHIRMAETIQLGLTPSPRTNINIHYRMQPVIDVSPDGRTAKLRTRLFHLTANAPGRAAGTFSSGMYPNDAAALVDGVWKFTNVAIDEPYFGSSSYRDGWARAKIPLRPAPYVPGAPIVHSGIFKKLVDTLPPDVPISAMPRRQESFIPGAIYGWPLIKPMWFHYVNPVSGRVPSHYCPDEWTCEQSLAAGK